MIELLFGGVEGEPEGCVLFTPVQEIIDGIKERKGALIFELRGRCRRRRTSKRVASLPALNGILHATENEKNELKTKSKLRIA